MFWFILLKEKKSIEALLEFWTLSHETKNWTRKGCGILLKNSVASSIFYSASNINSPFSKFSQVSRNAIIYVVLEAFLHWCHCMFNKKTTGHENLHNNFDEISIFMGGNKSTYRKAIFAEEKLDKFMPWIFQQNYVDEIQFAEKSNRSQGW